MRCSGRLKLRDFSSSTDILFRSRFIGSLPKLHRRYVIFFRRFKSIASALSPASEAV